MGRRGARRSPEGKEPLENPGGFFYYPMIGLTEVAAAAKRELGDMVLQNPVRVSCPKCGRFVVDALSVPTLVKGRCDRCRVDVIALVDKEQNVLAVTE